MSAAEGMRALLIPLALVGKAPEMAAVTRPVALSSATSPAAVSPRAEIEAASRAFDDAQLHKDGAALDRFLAADFQFVRGSGKLTDRNAFIASFTDPAVSFEPFVVTDRIYVELGPDAGTIGGEGVIRGTEGGKPFAERFRFADTFARRDGRWQVVYVQVTPLPN